MHYLAPVEDTYAEAFRSIYAEVLITARDRYWLEQAVHASTGNASSTIMCDCEAGLSHYVDGQHTPDGRPGAVIQFHVPRFWKDRAEKLERSLLVRIGQNVLTCPTTACFSTMVDAETYFPLGRKISYFGDGHQFRAERYHRPGWVIPILGGEFFLDRRFGYHDGLMGGNLWYFGKSQDAALDAAMKGVEAARRPGVIMPFPGGIAGSGSKAGSQYRFIVGSTFAEYCPTLREKLGEQSRLPPGVESVQEIILNGCDLPTISAAMQAAIAASRNTPGLERITAGNYGGKLGKSFIYLLPEKQTEQN
ncbi:MAG TPA: formylmethanofuran--tetrahydromethanopterin N-formyltransferase [Gemmatales bacterium]|nr:formylmethanofuran--tetrahydromethanopterin N-formyltransferase [Gemmatales bacterium]HMP15741.1 formylmethanofuran--tetrahydromethanopterin N-formyltransferase [Gemmatales bacterium]